MQIWQQILLGALALLALFVFWPGINQTMQKSREAEEKNWSSALTPIAVVVLFVLFLIILV